MADKKSSIWDDSLEIGGGIVKNKIIGGVEAGIQKVAPFVAAGVGKVAPIFGPMAEKFGSSVIPKLLSKPVQTAVELGKGALLIGTEGARKGHAEAGRELSEKSTLYQAGNLFLNTSDALSKYGAAHEEKGKSAFEAEHMAPLNEAIAKEEERVKGEMFAKQENERKQLEVNEMKTALDPDWDLEARTMGLVKNLTRPNEFSQAKPL